MDAVTLGVKMIKTIRKETTYDTARRSKNKRVGDSDSP